MAKRETKVSSKLVSRQRVWQRKQQAKGLCQTCARPSLDRARCYRCEPVTVSPTLRHVNEILQHMLGSVKHKVWIHRYTYTLDTLANKNSVRANALRKRIQGHYAKLEKHEARREALELSRDLYIIRVNSSLRAK